MFLFGIVLAAECAVDRSPADANAGKCRAESVTRTGVFEALLGYTGNKFGVGVEGVSTISGEVQAIDQTLPFAAGQVDLIEVESVTIYVASPRIY